MGLCGRGRVAAPGGERGGVGGEWGDGVGLGFRGRGVMGGWPAGPLPSWAGGGLVGWAVRPSGGVLLYIYIFGLFPVCFFCIIFSLFIFF